ncbi:MAG: peptidylprolyl isomerase [Deltaproteobacteria bacterium]|nr:peptidylprolyl isomerase [Deltaproteobacteria bacterium]
MFFIFAAVLILSLGLTCSAKALSSAPPKKVAVFETTLGNFKAELYNDLAPKTAGNFVSLVEKKFYDGTIFHRVIEGFMIQGGDPEGSGRGGPGYEIEDEFGPGLVHNASGILSMANAGPNTGGSQFFITLAPTNWLDGKHAIFGKIIEGFDIVEGIGSVDTDRSDRPQVEVKILRLYIEEN